MCFFRRKSKVPPVAHEQVSELTTEEIIEPLFSIDMVPVEPASVRSVRPAVRPEEFVVYKKED